MNFIKIGTRPFSIVESIGGSLSKMRCEKKEMEGRITLGEEFTKTDDAIMLFSTIKRFDTFD